MKTTRSKPLQPSKDERRTRLAQYFSEAIETLLDDGVSYADLSVEDLITAVDVSRSTFYSYFKDKSELLLAMGEDATADLSDAGEPWFNLPADGSERDLRKALQLLFDTYRRHHKLLKAIIETAAYDAQVRALHLALVDLATGRMREHIESQQRTGSVAPGLDATRTAQWLVWMLERGLYQIVAPASEREAGAHLDTVVNLVWRMLYEGHRR